MVEFKSNYLKSGWNSSQITNLVSMRKMTSDHKMNLTNEHIFNITLMKNKNYITGSQNSRRLKGS